MQLGSLAAIARRWWFTLVAATIVGAVAGWTVAGALPTSQRSESKLLVGPVNSDIETIRASTELTRTYAILATSSTVLQSAIGAGGIAGTPEALADHVRAVADDASRTLTISVELASADEAANAANAIAQALIAYVSEDTTRPEGELRVVDPAAPGLAATGPRLLLMVLLSAMAALLGAVLLVTLIEMVDSSLRDLHQVRQVAGGSLLGVIAPPRGRRRGPPDLDEPAEVTGYRRALADVAARAETPVRSLLILSSDGPEDAAAVVIGLAHAGRRSGSRVAIVRAAEASTNPDAVPEPPIDISPFAGWAVRDPDGARSLLADALDQANLAIIDGGAAPESVSAPIWARVADATVLVTRLGTSRRERVEQTLERLRAVPGVDPRILVLGSRVGRPRRAVRQRASDDRPAGERAPEDGDGAPAAPTLATDGAAWAGMSREELDEGPDGGRGVPIPVPTPVDARRERARRRRALRREAQ